MIPVFICEDEDGMRTEIREALEREILIAGYDMCVVCETKDPRVILEYVNMHGKRGIYFLDVELKGACMDGFLLGREIRRLDPRGFLVYVTAFGDLAFETFRYHLEALDYIVKGNAQEMFVRVRQCLGIISDRLLQEQGDGREYFTVRQLDMMRQIPMDEIYFFETTDKKHHILMHYRYGIIDFAGSLNDLEKKLGDKFLRIHRAYLVHVCQIRKIDLKNKQVILENGEQCWFSRKGRAVLQRYVKGADLH